MTQHPVVNPYTLDQIGEVSLVDWDEADAWMERAYQTFRDRRNWLPAHKRIEILEKVAGLMKDRAEDLAHGIANEGGKPLVDARVEVARAIDGVGLCVKELLHPEGKTLPMDLTAAGEGRLAFIEREPIGVVVAVSAFNHPLNLTVHQVGPAVAVGCPVIVKPASDTPLSCKAFVDMLLEAGLPEAWVKFAPCRSDVATKMVTDQRTAFFSFIGSGGVGWMLRSKLAPGTRCALEHGGVAPVIVDGSADIDAMIPLLTKGGFYHAGQVCVSVQKVFAPHSMATDIAARLGDAASALTVDDAIHAHTDVGPLIRPAEVTRVADWVSAAAGAGATIVTGGERLGETAYAPTVLLNPPHDSDIAQKEVFGPAIAVFGVDSVGDAIARANSLDVAFQAAVFTSKLDVAMACVQRIDATAVMVNDHTAFRVDWMPFAGRRHSGYGTGGIGYTMHDMTQDKMAVIRL